MLAENGIPKVLLWGGKGKARIIDAMLKESGVGNTALIFDSLLEKPLFETNAFFTNNIKELSKNLSKVTHYVTCLGGGHGYARYKTSVYLEKLGLKPLSIVHEKSFVEPSAKIGVACQIMPCAVVHKFTEIGDHTILNTNSTVDHECIIGKGVHVMGSAAIAGRVKIGDYATVGTNATVLPFVKIGEGAFIGGGALVNKDVDAYTIVAGVPAQVMRENKFIFREKLLIDLINSCGRET